MIRPTSLELTPTLRIVDRLGYIAGQFFANRLEYARKTLQGM